MFTELRDVQLRTAMESQLGVYIAEGEKVIRRAVAAGHRPHSFLLAPRWAESLADVLARFDVPCHVLDEDEIESITGFHVHRGALAAFERPEPVPIAGLLSGARRIVVVELRSADTIAASRSRRRYALIGPHSKPPRATSYTAETSAARPSLDCGVPTQTKWTSAVRAASLTSVVKRSRPASTPSPRSRPCRASPGSG